MSLTGLEEDRDACSGKDKGSRLWTKAEVSMTEGGMASLCDRTNEARYPSGNHIPRTFFEI